MLWSTAIKPRLTPFGEAAMPSVGSDSSHADEPALDGWRD